ncbi:acyltransferase family protein [Specibacter sp. NPDC057265]|uniref:acyltransferase family protein n=1 Tax=Specibacter sp. NPDC057265 TaxID=3346075 RepID=UPI003635AD12
MTEVTVQQPNKAGRGSTASKRAGDALQPRKYRSEVQGLRALAVLMVVSYHVWFGRISGGVDVFLLISAFLLTGQFARKMESGRPLELLKYWTRLFKRLLPMIAVTLLITLGAAYFFLPESTWMSLFDQTWASLFYYQNWHLAAEAVDYYAADHSSASPLQHFWSLSIQGQIFILWPIIFAVTAFLSQVFRLKAKRLLIWMFCGIFLISLVFSIITTQNNQLFAYFDTRARLWEFALGSIVALILPSLRLGRMVRLFLGWLGVVAMISCGLILQVGQQFPGYMALWPTLAAACVIAAGQTGSKFGVDRLLSAKPLVKLGDSSYALYLFHWPVLVIFLVTSGRDQAGPKAGLAIILLSIIAAWALTKYVDDPLRRHAWFAEKSSRSLIVILACIVSVAVPVTAWQAHINNLNESLLANASKNNPGAASLWPGYVDNSNPDAPLLPLFANIHADWPVFPEPCIADEEENINLCTNGNDGGEKSVVILGSSHAHVLNTPILEMAEDYNWNVTSMTMGYCPLGLDPAAGLTEACVAFNQEKFKEVLDLKPDLVVTTSTRTSALPEVAEQLDSSWVEEAAALNAAGIQVLAFRDTPRFMQSVPECLENNPNDYAQCSTPTNEIYPAVSPTDPPPPVLGKTSFIDLTSSFCSETSCPAVIGNVVVYKDDNHVTATYMKTLRPIFEREFLAATGW